MQEYNQYGTYLLAIAKERKTKAQSTLKESRE